MTEREYAACIYRRVFNVAEDGGDAYAKGILRTIGKLDEQERLMLESYYRHGQTYKQMGKDLGLSADRVSKAVQKAVNKLRHPSRVRDMSMARIEKDRDMYRQRLAEVNDILMKKILDITRNI